MARWTPNVESTIPGRRSAAGLRLPATGGSRSVVVVACVLAVVSGGWRATRAESVAAMRPRSITAQPSAESRGARVLPPATHLRTVPDDEGGRAGATTEDSRRLYVTGMVGSSLAAHGGSDSRDMVVGGLLAGGLPAGDGALGVAIPRGFGDVRLEFEGRSGIPSAASDGAGGDSWSVMANVWRDLPITEHLGGYVGGGVGAAGLPTAGGTRGGVAGQAGAGLTYAAHDRLTFDVGYRLHAATDGRTLPGGAAALAASELLLSVRIYDPFRRWSR